MDWHEVKDSSNRYILPSDWGVVGDFYEPQEVQDMIDDVGVEQMVHDINKEFKSRGRKPPLRLSNKSGLEVLVW